jgi:hypothetical protein
MDAKLLNNALSLQAELYERLLKLAQQQHECVQQERTDELLEVLNRRQGVVEQITKLESVLRPVKQDWTNVSKQLDEVSLKLAQGALSKSRDLLQQITAADEDDALLLQQRKMAVGRQLNQARAGSGVNQKYAVSAYVAAPATRMDVSR